MSYSNSLGWRVRRYWTVWAGLFGLLSLIASAQPGAEGPAIELPKFLIQDARELPPPEAWRYASIPGFEILSNASDRTTRRLLNDFQLFQQALSIVWPTPPTLSKPVLVILCGKGGKFESFVPSRTEGGPDTARASVCLNGRRQSAIVVDVETRIVNIAGGDFDAAEMGVDATRFSIEHNKQLYREYVRYLLSQSETRLPAWFEEGLSQIVMAMKFYDKWIEFGKLADPNTVPAGTRLPTPDEEGGLDIFGGAPIEDRDFNAVLARRALISLDKFFAVKNDSPVALNPLGNNVWAKQAYAFVHMGLFGEKGRWKKPFSEFLYRSTQEPVTEELFKQCFKMSYKEMALQLRSYVQWTQYQSLEYRAKKGGGPLLVSTKIELRDATQSEVGRIKGSAKLLAGYAEEARTEFIAPYIRGERDPQLLAVLGLAERSAGKPDRAKKFLEAAVAGKTNDPEAYRELARYALASPPAAADDTHARITAEQMGAVIGFLNTARTLMPPDPATYELYAEAWARSPAKPKREDLAVLVEGIRLYPRHLRLIYRTAEICVDAGFTDSAESLVEHGLKVALDVKTKGIFEELKLQVAKAAADQKKAP